MPAAGSRAWKEKKSALFNLWRHSAIGGKESERKRLVTRFEGTLSEIERATFQFLILGEYGEQVTKTNATYGKKELTKLLLRIALEMGISLEEISSDVYETAECIHRSLIVMYEELEEASNI